MPTAQQACAPPCLVRAETLAIVSPMVSAGDPTSDEAQPTVAVEGEQAGDPAREEERQWVIEAKAGDKQALAKILRRHGPRLYRSVLLPRLGSEAAAQDALADTYVRVVERFDTYEWRSCGIYPWLRVVAMRIALDALRSRKRETLFQPSDMVRAIERAERDLDDGIDVKLCEKRDLEQARERLQLALSAINQRYQTAIRSRILEDRSRAECAAELGVSVATFDVVLHRALKSLKLAIARQEEAST